MRSPNEPKMVEIGSHGASPHILEVLVIIPYLTLVYFTWTYLFVSRRSLQVTLNRFARSIAHMTRFVSWEYPHIGVKNVATPVHFHLPGKLQKSPIFHILWLKQCSLLQGISILCHNIVQNPFSVQGAHKTIAKPSGIGKFQPKSLNRLIDDNLRTNYVMSVCVAEWIRSRAAWSLAHESGGPGFESRWWARSTTPSIPPGSVNW